tara:strand:- start:304 stop:429 length:126 start_codon:yes stop_codon:yes gene_type:complete
MVSPRVLLLINLVIKNKKIKKNLDAKHMVGDKNWLSNHMEG